MPTRVHRIHRIMLTVQIRLLIQIGVTRGEGSDLRIVVPASDLEQPGIAIVAVTGIGPEKEN